MCGTIDTRIPPQLMVRHSQETRRQLILVHIHLYPTTCPNLLAPTMKSKIFREVKEEEGVKKVKDMTKKTSKYCREVNEKKIQETFKTSGNLCRLVKDQVMEVEDLPLQ